MIPAADRAPFLGGLLGPPRGLKGQRRRPHSAHLLAGAGTEAAVLPSAEDLRGVMLVTQHPEQVAPEVLSQMELIVLTGEATASGDRLATIARALGLPLPSLAGSSSRPARRSDGGPAPENHPSPSGRRPRAPGCAP